MFANAGFSQRVDDRAVIPVAVTLNSILRLNVESGGNIEFAFNTLSDYQNGFTGDSDARKTVFSVASSVRWKVEMFSENATLVGTNSVAGSPGVNFELDNIGYHVVGAAPNVVYSATAMGVPAILEATPVSIAAWSGVAGTTNAGGSEVNRFEIFWQCGTRNAPMNGASILQQSLPADRYATNVFLILSED